MNNVFTRVDSGSPSNSFLLTGAATFPYGPDSGQATERGGAIPPLSGSIWQNDQTCDRWVLNRFSKDVFEVDADLPYYVNHHVTSVVSLAVLLIIVFSVLYVLLPVLLPIAWLYRRFSDQYRRSAREFFRLQSISRSPVYANLSETLNGLSTIRAYGYGQQFVAKHARLTDHYHIAFYISKTSQGWLRVRSGLVGGGVVGLTVSFVALFPDFVDVGVAAFVITTALSVTFAVGYFVHILAEMETRMTSLERIIGYTGISSEPPRLTQDVENAAVLPSGWPKTGEVELRDVKLRYREELPLVLHGVSVHIAHGERVGVIGRTGSGKSSLLQLLLRLVPYEGTLLLDGVDVSRVGLQELRSSVSLIPQDPLLFNASLWFNLDPFEAHTEEELWRVLEKVHLADMVRGLPARLQHVVSEGGTNLSVGERQLMCIARTLLRRSPLVLLDEATASVDAETDSLIQEMVRTALGDATVITVAHRLNTVMDSHRILCLDAGRVVEFDAPNVLLQDPRSHLSRFVDETGPEHAAGMRQMAQRAAKTREAVQ